MLVSRADGAGQDTIQRKEIGQRFKDKYRDYDHVLIFAMSGLKLYIKFGLANKILVGGLQLVVERVG